MAHETVTVTVRIALQEGRERAMRTGRTQQIELGDNLFVRLAPDGQRFLLFCLGGELPDDETAFAAAAALGFEHPVFKWHDGPTIRSRIVENALDSEA